MRIGLLSTLALAISATCALPAQASYDEDMCSAEWSLEGSGHCNSVPFLSPTNDSRVNLRLLLADQGVPAFDPTPIADHEREAGYGPVPFDITRLDPAPLPALVPPPATTPVSVLDEPLQQLGLGGMVPSIAGNAFIDGEGSRCRSNNEDSAAAFIKQLIASPELPAPERLYLAQARLNLLNACDTATLSSPPPATIASAPGLTFLAYLRGAAQFYSGAFADATQTFASLSTSEQPWLKETALYMSGRIPLNAAQANAFDDMGLPTYEHVDEANLKLAEQGFEHYLKTYPQGDYSASARGLIRRVHWLAGDDKNLADDYAWQLTAATEAQRNKSLPELIEETDSKLLSRPDNGIQAPLLLAIKDLQNIGGYQTTFSSQQLEGQKALFAQQPGLYDYLHAAVLLRVENNPEAALGVLPANIVDNPDHLAFSQQFLRGQALHAQKKWPEAQAHWLQLMTKVKRPLQYEQVELALTSNYLYSEQIDKIFATGSPIKTPALRYRLQRMAADAPLLRQQVSQGADATERDSALFVLLYKELLRNQYAAFAEDMKRLPAEPSTDNLGVSIGYLYGSGRPLSMFRWQGEQSESAYRCPSIADTATALQANGKDPRGLNCLGEFILRNKLDDSPVDERSTAAPQPGVPVPFKGDIYARHEGYRQVIGDTQAPKEDRAYALFRAINCYAPSGNNSCGGTDVEPAVRKAWFRQLKSGFADTPWGKSLQYYW
ncbi:outer membrane assembly lipoprotein YfiO [Pseudomonas purpurea]|uniref:outer membrane assembly lipoprotein YfiO n=1 Tax=Pseudomonas purpurea TaxID=3136737 RepID=UPI0032661BEB